MKTLCMDSAHKHLVIVLLEDGEIKDGCSCACWKKQSETLFPELINCMDRVGWKADDIDEVVISDGPGSYTGVRIAMSVAKVLCTRKQLPLYCLSTLQLYAGLQDHTLVMMDARSSRAYVGVVHQGTFEVEETIMTLEEVEQYLQTNPQVTLAGDTSLLGKEETEVNFMENFKVLRPFARKVENVHTLTPRYLKDQDAYQVK